jgi:hypothetical protein
MNIYEGKLLEKFTLLANRAEELHWCVSFATGTCTTC